MVRVQPRQAEGKAHIELEGVDVKKPHVASLLKDVYEGKKPKTEYLHRVLSEIPLKSLIHTGVTLSNPEHAPETRRVGKSLLFLAINAHGIDTSTNDALVRGLSAAGVTEKHLVDGAVSEYRKSQYHTDQTAAEEHLLPGLKMTVGRRDHSHKSVQRRASETLHSHYGEVRFTAKDSDLQGFGSEDAFKKAKAEGATTIESNGRTFNIQYRGKAKAGFGSPTYAVWEETPKGRAYLSGPQQLDEQLRGEPQKADVVSYEEQQAAITEVIPEGMMTIFNREIKGKFSQSKILGSKEAIESFRQVVGTIPEGRRLSFCKDVLLGLQDRGMLKQKEDWRGYADAYSEAMDAAGDNGAVYSSSFLDIYVKFGSVKKPQDLVTPLKTVELIPPADRREFISGALPEIVRDHYIKSDAERQTLNEGVASVPEKHRLFFTQHCASGFIYVAGFKSKADWVNAGKAYVKCVDGMPEDVGVGTRSRMAMSVVEWGRIESVDEYSRFVDSLEHMPSELRGEYTEQVANSCLEAAPPGFKPDFDKMVKAYAKSVQGMEKEDRENFTHLVLSRWVGTEEGRDPSTWTKFSESYNSAIEHVSSFNRQQFSVNVVAKMIKKGTSLEKLDEVAKHYEQASENIDQLGGQKLIFQSEVVPHMIAANIPSDRWLEASNSLHAASEHLVGNTFRNFTHHVLPARLSDGMSTKEGDWVETAKGLNLAMQEIDSHQQERYCQYVVPALSKKGHIGTKESWQAAAKKYQQATEDMDVVHRVTMTRDVIGPLIEGGHLDMGCDWSHQVDSYEKFMERNGSSSLDTLAVKVGDFAKREDFSWEKANEQLDIIESYTKEYGDLGFIRKTGFDNFGNLTPMGSSPKKMGFVKDGSELIPLSGKMSGVIFRVITEDAYDTWVQAEEAGIPCEEILRYPPGHPRQGQRRATKTKDGRMRVSCLFGGVDFPEFFKDGKNKEHTADVQKQKLNIIEQLDEHHIIHGHTHDKNFLVRMEDGNPKVFLIDFDRAASTKDN